MKIAKRVGAWVRERSTWTRGAEGLSWVLRAARYERRIYAGAFFAGLVSIAVSLPILYSISFLGFAGMLLFGVPMALLVSLGFGVPLFVLFAWGGLFRRMQIWTPHGIAESWVNPDIEGRVPYNLPGYVRYVNGVRTVIVLSGYGDEWDGQPLPYRRELRLYTTADVNKAIDKDQDIDHFKRARRIPNIPIRMGALAVIIASALFIGLALVSTPPAQEQNASAEVSR